MKKHFCTSNTIVKLTILLSAFFYYSSSFSQDVPEFIDTPELNTILENADVKGSILIFDYLDNKLFSNDFDWAEKGHLPASTFKIQNSIIALETGVVESDTTILKWDGKKRRLAKWEKDMDLREAFRLSCVPCYQEIARKIGPDRMTAKLNSMRYPLIKITDENIDKFWLEGKLKVNQYQQVDFLKRLYFGELPIDNASTQIMKRIMVLEETDNYRLSAKTGWAIRNGNNIGWFIGILESNNKIYFFATNIQPNEDFNMDMFYKIRLEITMEAFKKLRLIK
ncbi:class D beta-lactamase [Bacteroidota bacterium]